MQFLFGDTESRLNKVLASKNCPSTRGYTYLKAAVLMAHAEPDLLHSVNKGLYRAIADKNKATLDSVERCVRTLIEKWWESGLKNDTLFDKKPTNRECIVRFVDMLKPQEGPKTMEEWMERWERRTIMDDIMKIV